jgi:hypothetical protein
MQHDASVKSVCGRLRVRHHEQRGTFTATCRHQGLEHLLSRQRIQVSGRLIRKDNPRPVGERPGNRHTLLFPARQEARQGRCPCAKTKTVKPLISRLHSVSD